MEVLGKIAFIRGAPDGIQTGTLLGLILQVSAEARKTHGWHFGSGTLEGAKVLTYK